MVFTQITISRNNNYIYLSQLFSLYTQYIYIIMYYTSTESLLHDLTENFILFLLFFNVQFKTLIDIHFIIDYVGTVYLYVVLFLFKFLVFLNKT